MEIMAYSSILGNAGFLSSTVVLSCVDLFEDSRNERGIFGFL